MTLAGASLPTSGSAGQVLAFGGNRLAFDYPAAEAAYTSLAARCERVDRTGVDRLVTEVLVADIAVLVTDEAIRGRDFIKDKTIA